MRGLRSIRWQLQAWHGVLLAAILGFITLFFAGAAAFNVLLSLGS